MERRKFVMLALAGTAAASLPLSRCGSDSDNNRPDLLYHMIGRNKYKQPENLSQGDTVIASEKKVFQIIETKYKFNLLKRAGDVNIYLIK